MKQRLVILIASVVLGLVGAFLTGQYLNAKDREVAQRLQQLTQNYRKVPVIVAKRNLPVGTELTAEDVGVMDLVENALRGHVVKEEDARMLLHRRLIGSVEKQAPIFWSDIEGGDRLNRGLASDIKSGMRAISIGVGGTAAVTGMIKPNDHIDVLGTFTFPSETRPNETEMVTLTIMQDVLVLATGQETAKSTINSPDRAGSSYSSVTIEVTPREAEVLVFAEQARGRLVLTLRNPDDIYYEKELPRIDFAKIQSELLALNTNRQQRLLLKPAR